MGKIEIETNGSQVIIDVTNLTAEQITNIKDILSYKEEIPNPNSPILDENENIIGYNMMPNDKPWVLEWTQHCFGSFIVKLEEKAREKINSDAELTINAIKNIL